MKQFFGRFLRRAIPVALVLGLFGSIMGYSLYTAMISYTNEESDSASRILWRAPLTLASLGVIFLLISELMAAWVRHQRSKYAEFRLSTTVSSTSHIEIPPPPVPSVSH